MNVKDYESIRCEILKVLVKLYVKKAIPVSSRSIARRSRLGYSSATIRNIMADLKESGHIIQPHTSAGSVPTDKGYRFYVDYLMDQENLTTQECSELDKQYFSHHLELNEAVNITSKALSSITNYTSFAVLPSLRKISFSRLELVSLGNKRVLSVLITNANYNHSAVIELADKVVSTELNQIKNFLNHELNGVALGRMREHLRNQVSSRKDPVFLFNQSLKMLDLIAPTSDKGRFHLEGLSFILSEPEFYRNLSKAKEVLASLEEPEDFYNLFNENADEDRPMVKIGHENTQKAMSECTVVVKKYDLSDNLYGMIGLIGPRRLRYGRAISAVKYLANQIKP